MVNLSSVNSVLWVAGVDKLCLRVVPQTLEIVRHMQNIYARRQCLILIKGEIWSQDLLRKEWTCTRDKSKARNRRRRVGGPPGEGASVPETKVSEKGLLCQRVLVNLKGRGHGLNVGPRLREFFRQVCSFILLGQVNICVYVVFWAICTRI